VFNSGVKDTVGFLLSSISNSVAFYVALNPRCQDAEFVPKLLITPQHLTSCFKRNIKKQRGIRCRFSEGRNVMETTLFRKGIVS
jgi:hypothetical protein